MTDSINVSRGFSLSLAGKRVRTGFDLYILFPSEFSWKKNKTRQKTTTCEFYNWFYLVKISHK